MLITKQIGDYSESALFSFYLFFYGSYRRIVLVTVQIDNVSWVHGQLFFLLTTSGHFRRTRFHFWARYFWDFGWNFISVIFRFYFRIFHFRSIAKSQLISGHWFKSVIFRLGFYFHFWFFLFRNFCPFRWWFLFVGKIFRADIIIQTFTAFRVLKQEVSSLETSNIVWLTSYDSYWISHAKCRGKLTRAGHICWPKPTSILLTSRHLSFGSQLSNCFRVSSGFFGYKNNKTLKLGDRLL